MVIDITPDNMTIPVDEIENMTGTMDTGVRCTHETMTQETTTQVTIDQMRDNITEIMVEKMKDSIMETAIMETTTTKKIVDLIPGEILMVETIQVKELMQEIIDMKDIDTVMTKMTIMVEGEMVNFNDIMGIINMNSELCLN